MSAQSRHATGLVLLAVQAWQPPAGAPSGAGGRQGFVMFLYKDPLAWSDTGSRGTSHDHRLQAEDVVA